MSATTIAHADGSASYPAQPTPGGYPGAGDPASPAATATPTIGPGAERELEELRSRVFPAAVCHLALGIVGIPFCWVGYGFVLVLAILLIVVGSIGIAHLGSMSGLRFSTCCCFPLNAVRQLHTWYVVTCVFAVLATATSVIQTCMDDNKTTRIFAAIAVILSLLALGALMYAVKAITELRDRCAADEQMIAGPFAGHVVGGQPTSAQMAGAPADGSPGGGGAGPNPYQAHYYPQAYTVYAVPQQQPQQQQHHHQPPHTPYSQQMQQPHPYQQHVHHQQQQQQQQQQYQHHHHHQPTYPPPQPAQGYYTTQPQGPAAVGTPVLGSPQPLTPGAPVTFTPGPQSTPPPAAADGARRTSKAS